MTKYKLRFPIQFDVTRFNNCTDIEVPLPIPDIRLRISVNDSWCVINADNFESKAKAEECFDRIQASVAWMMINRDVPFRTRQLQNEDDNKTNLSRNFGSVFEQEGKTLIDYDTPVTVPEMTQLLPLGISATVQTHEKLENLVTSIQRAFKSPQTEILKDEKLRLAIELYRDHLYERSSKSKFLLLVIILEVLGEEKSKPKIIEEIFDSWAENLQELQKNCDKDSDEYRDLQDLQKSLRNIWGSKRSKIRELVLRTYQQVNDPDAEKAADRAKKIYDTRSKLVHGNEKLKEEELQNALYDLKPIVQKLLQVKFCFAMGEDYPCN